ncbi:MAG: MotA/TolQ/ExbB proton channel family protein [Lacrimispora sp.]|uniref:motility protein A n=1 Tax=Lacrimispora sp. TaxID=2719234 RepID=UPI0039E61AE1
MSRFINTSLIGLFLGAFFIISAMFTSGHLNLFYNVPSALMIFGGTAASVIMAFPPKTLKTFGHVFLKSFRKENYDLKDDIVSLIRCAEISRKNGLLALENHIDDLTNDEYLKMGIRYIIDGTDEEQLRNIMEGATHFMKLRHAKSAAMLNMIGATAPALGLLGTYVGLIPMLNSLDDPSALGPMMAIELVSSFYGAFVANIIFSPLGRKLVAMDKEEAFRRELLLEGLVGIQQGKNPRMIKEELSAFANINLDDEENPKKKGKKVKEPKKPKK